AVRSKGIASNFPVTPGAISGPVSFQCSQSGVTYSVAPVSNASTYLWTTSCGSIGGPNNLNSVSIDWPGNATACTLAVTASNSCGTSAARTLVVEMHPGAPSSISGNTSVCSGAGENYCAVGSMGGSSYTWTIPSGATILGSSTGSCITVLWGSTGGSITVKANNSCGSSAVRILAIAVTCRGSAHLATESK